MERNHLQQNILDYLISCQQNHLIQHMGGNKEADWEWNFSWRRPLFDNEIPMAVDFLQHIESKPIQIHRRDEWVWTADSSGQYTTKSAYKMMRGGDIDGTQDRAFEELLIPKRAPTKCSVKCLNGISA